MLRILSLLLLLAAPVFAQAPDAAQSFDKANRLYAEQDYEGARQAYEKLVKSGARDAAVFLNLGHAEYRLDRPALAAINYRRALALDPSNGAARSSLEHVQRELGQPAAGVGFADLAGQYISFDLLALLGSLIFWAGLLLVVFAVFSKQKRTGLLLLGIFVAIVGATAVAVSWAGDSRIALAQISIITDDAVARSAPAENGQKLSDLKQGAAVRVLASRDDWSLVRLPVGIDGWVPSSKLEPVFFPPAP
ncbi:MAG: SH3 domain-containing protein [Chthoniobacterales bacterium]